MRLNSLSGRFAVLTIIFVIMAELFILLPALAVFRRDYLDSRLERAQIAGLALLATDNTLASDLEAELLQNAGVFNVVLRRDDLRQLVLSSPIPGPVAATYDLRESNPWQYISDAMSTLITTGNAVIRVIGAPVNQAGQLIEITMPTAPLRKAMIDYGLQVLVISAAFSIFTAILLNIATHRMILAPIRSNIRQILAYSKSPDDPRHIIVPSSSVAEFRAGELVIGEMQKAITTALRQKDRMAQLGQAVAKISHDLRNILTTAQIFADRLEESADPKVKRAAPKLLNSLTRAVHLCESSLAFGNAEEPAPSLTLFNLAQLAFEVIEAETLALQSPDQVEFSTNIPPQMTIRADHDQLYRVLSNLVRNARQAIEGSGLPGKITINAGEADNSWWICVSDNGPGLPAKAREFLFRPFTGGARKGGTGLGLSIAADLIHGHGGTLELLHSNEKGSEFKIRIPREMSVMS